MKTKSPSYSLPVQLQLAGRPCLVVGGGRVALRKTGHLIDAGARVRVVCPALGSDFAPLVDGGAVEHVARPFAPEDIGGMALVFACTNDRAVNRQVLEACRAEGVLCSCADGNWRDSDFTTPAITRHGELTLTVSTGGQSCRRAKLVKDSLARHIESVETAELIVVGTDHQHLPLEMREPLHLTGERLAKAGFMIMQLWGVHEFMLLNTCNRIELMAVVSRETATNGILRHVLGFDRLHADQYYVRRGQEAWAHSALVCAGMLSQTPGEYHVAAQEKEALAAALEKGWAGGMMQAWMDSALHTSKHIKNDVVPRIPVCEIEELALRCLQAQEPDLHQQTLMVIGTGSIGREVVRLAGARVGRVIWCYHVNRPVLPAGGRIERCAFDAIRDRLAEVDAVITAVEAPGHVLQRADAPLFNPGKLVRLIDLGVPRNTDPALAGQPPVASLMDMDGLKHWFRNEQAGMDAHLAHCRQIINDHHEYYERLIKRFQGGNA